MSGNFNELTRVQMPALVHLTRLGYEYYGKITENFAGIKYDPDTNILLDVFEKQFKKINPEKKDFYDQVLKDIRLELDNDDIGKSFYNRLVSTSPVKLIDFDNLKNNVFHCTAEFTCKRDDDEFRPDITLFVNGLPLVFIEVKKPNNTGGMLAESKRMNEIRFPNKKFRRFINITQLMIFSNNMEYDTEGGIVPIQGAFYCTAAKKSAPFNCFREENKGGESIAPYNAEYPYLDINKDVERKILSDFNCQVIHTSSEYKTNLNINTPTNRVITSMCSPERLLFIIKYGIAYVKIEKEEDGKIVSIDQKHIMRYQQMFAALAVRDQLSKGVKSGVIWHTQGSGKTALSYYLNKVLTDYFASVNKVAKFYFIVDRLDLLKQASQEFIARGLEVKTANSKAELMEQFRENNSLHGSSGKSEITVVNIQRFAEDKEKVRIAAYATNLQRIFIIDEAHRGYNPKGSFLANLFDADKDSIKIALTGTPLLKAERASWKIFGNYLHTYYYDKSIQDGYTLKIIREDIETSYKEKLQAVYDDLDKLVLKKDVKKSDIVEHDVYVKELLRYIINDLNQFRQSQGNPTLGGMIVCETSEQARKIYKFFDIIQNEINQTNENKSELKAALILHDEGDKESRNDLVDKFKKEQSIDVLIVFNMLLTGFDAPRLKKLYLGRKLKDHNLLQAITRVNRPYQDCRYGYIVDFADIKDNFEETNQNYLEELNRFNNPDEVGEGNTTNSYLQVLEDKDVIIERMKNINRSLFNYTLNNAEVFSQEISSIENKDTLYDLRKNLIDARDYTNIVRTFGDETLKVEFGKFEIRMIPQLISEVQRHIGILNQKEYFERSDATKQMINEAMANITFTFSKISTDEMRIISTAQFQEKWDYTIHSFTQNEDQEDPEYITLREAFMARFKEHGFVIDSIAQFNEETKALSDFINKLKELKQKNNALASKYNGDMKFARIHKRIKERNYERRKSNQSVVMEDDDLNLVYNLNIIKDDIDEKVYDRNDILKKDAYFKQTVMKELTSIMKNMSITSNRDDRVFMQNCITRQYLNQYNNTYGTQL
ncbi:HsdR family type I site-specific deoxyribonuclease [Holdemanella biformis]|uniref:type I restriction endonuclease subunit R n=1 Tax=Holdemanella biformis TaxID=1735 RepID=UPI001C3841C1|nr:HsdR family type I site-specific deoxyribonuclease [Holdemanella biformis]MBV3416211.1 HsdR family type I site-specific deoxyribonuclease [Holdemanella biformis]